MTRIARERSSENWANSRIAVIESQTNIAVAYAGTKADTGRVALHGAAHKGRADVIQVLYDHGAKLDIRDYGNTDNRGGKLAIHTWQAVDYADGLVRVGVQSAIAHPEAGTLLRKLMTAQGLQAPPMGRTLESICITEACE